MALPINIDDSNSVVIANGASLSGAVGMAPDCLAGLIMPAAWTAASITFQVSDDGGTTFNELYDDAGNEVTIVAAAGQRIIFTKPEMWRTVTMVKLRSGTSGSPVAQGAARTIGLVLKPFA